MKVGECFHLVNSFICSEGKNQNFPCPHRCDFQKCTSFVPVKQEMVDQMNNQGWTSVSCAEGTIHVDNNENIPFL